MNFNSSVFQGLIRHGLTALGAYLVSRGKLDAGSVDTIVGALMALAATGWSVTSKKAG